MNEKIILLVEDNPDDVTLTLRADERTKLVPVVILTSSKEEQVLLTATNWAATAISANLWTLTSSLRR